MKIFTFLFLVINILIGVSSDDDLWEEFIDDNDVSETSENVEAVLGKTVNLPCETESKNKENRVYMVLWFKKDNDKPIYSFDARGRPFGKELHWSDERSLGPRAYFVTLSRPASLQLDNVQLRDEGTYRCRVDYRNAPTRNFQIHLTVIVPPHQIIIYGNSGREIQDTIGPLLEGESLLVTCEVRGGKPLPYIRWLVNNIVVNNYTVSVEQNIVTSRLEIINLNRTFHRKIFVCETFNTHLIKPIRKNIVLTMFLKPTMVRIIQKYETMDSNKQYTIDCLSEGSIPPATVSLWKSNLLLNSTNKMPNRSVRMKKDEFNGETGSSSIYSVSLRPKPQDNGALVKCRAANPRIDNFQLEDSFKMNVLYSPAISLQLGNKLISDRIKEKDDVYFECKVDANPAEYKISWFCNDKQILQNIPLGVILSGKSLVLRKITRHNTGWYKCSATNVVGHASSDPIFLDVKFVPVCEKNEAVTIGAVLGEVVDVECTVLANPSEVDFKWIFNNSGQIMVVPKERYRLINSTTSKLIYTLTSEKDYGTLTCSSNNPVGQQSQPCTFYVLKAGKPSALSNCTFEAKFNKSLDDDDQLILDFICVAGYNGGLQQHYNLEILSNANPIANITSALNPQFTLDISKYINEKQHSDLIFVLYSWNTRGRSEQIVFEDIVTKEIRSKMVAELSRTEQIENEKKQFFTFGIVSMLSLSVIIASTLIGLLLIKNSKNLTTTLEKKSKIFQNAEEQENCNSLVSSSYINHTQPDILINKVLEDDKRIWKSTIIDSESTNYIKTNNSVEKETKSDEKEEAYEDDNWPPVATLIQNKGAFHKISVDNVICSKVTTDAVFGPESSV